MIFKPKAKYKLPKFPPTVIPTFRNYCHVLDAGAFQKLCEALELRINELRLARGKNENLDLNLAERIFESCQFLLSEYNSRGSKEQALIAGAVAYFAIEQDAIRDETFATGLYDDAKVVNHVLEKMGIEGRFIEVE